MTAQSHGHNTPTPPEPDEVTPLGPDSLLWKYAGQWLFFLAGPRAGMLQLMYPHLGLGVEQHSDFFNDPWDRIFRSIPLILGTVYDDPQAQTATKVRDYHRDIKGTDGQGRRYHALDPETYFWAHATFIDAVITAVDMFDHKLSREEKKQLYAEGKQWYRRYGLSERPMPPDWDAFCAYWDHTVNEVLQATRSAQWVADQTQDPRAVRHFPGMPDPVWRLLRPLLMEENRLLAAGMLPPAARERLGMSWTRRDRRRFRRRVRLIRRAWPLLPQQLRYHPRALAGMRRTASVAAA